MKEFNQQFDIWLKSINLFDSIHNNYAYREYYRTKGLSAYNFSIQPTKKVINQYYTKYVFPDGSMLKISSNRNKIDLNTMRYYASESGNCYAERMLFGISSKMPWDKE